MSEPTKCTVCRSVNRHEIDLLLTDGGTSISEIARRTGLSRTSIQRHRDNHLPKGIIALGDLSANAPALSADELQAQVQGLYVKCLELLALAEAGSVVGTDADGNEVRKVSVSNVLKCVREARSTVETMAKLAYVAPVRVESSAAESSDLDERISRALAAALERRMLPAGEAVDSVVVDAEVVE